MEIQISGDQIIDKLQKKVGDYVKTIAVLESMIDILKEENAALKEVNKK